MRILFRALKAVTIVTLVFFSWTYLPLYQIAVYATTKQEKTILPSSRQSGGPSGKLEKLLDDLREKIGKAEEKVAKGQDSTSEIDSIKSRKSEIDAVDADFRKDFAATEKKLKDANLPKEILNRHNAFVKNYEDNLSELRANIDAIEKAKTPAALKAEIVKTKTHLEKVKPPKKHVPLDPNKLPNRIVKAKERQPKLKKEEWEKELKKKPNKQKKVKAAQRQQQKPIIVASNGPLTGLLSGTDSFSASIGPEENWQLAGSNMDGVILSAATMTYPYPEEMYPLPWQTDMTAEDKQETPETHVTDAIRVKAAELGNNPIKMFNWLRNNIYLVPSYGSIQGADMCLQTRQCNATDIASLTVAMFRAADWPARYEFQTVELDIDRFMENMGGFTDPTAAITFAATGGIPVRPVISGGKITAVQFEHVYATALLPMGFYIGAVMKKGWSEPMWMPLDVSLKHYVTTPGLDISSAVPFDAQSFASQIQSTATINETEGYVTNVNSALIQQTMQDYQTRVQDYISQNTPTATVGDVLGKREIKQESLPHLYPTGWTKPVTARIQSHTLPNSMKSTISFNIPDPGGIENGLSYTTSLPEIAGKKITISFSPATATDQNVILSYLPKPHSDGTPIQPNELSSSLPAYLINLKPELRIDGQVVASGVPVTMGAELAFTLSLNEPGIGMSNIDNIVRVGEYFGIGLDTGRIGPQNMNALKSKLASTQMKLSSQLYNDITKDDIVGDILYATIALYFGELNKLDEFSAVPMDIIRYRAPSVGMCSLNMRFQEVFGITTNAKLGGLMMDVDRVMQAVAAKDGSQDKVKKYMLTSGIMSSALEHQIPEQIYSNQDVQVLGISSVKALKIANDNGIPIYTLTQRNIQTLLPSLQVSTDLKNVIVNAVNAGKEVTISKTNITYNSWSGVGYFIIDPTTGAGAYMISGGLNGAAIMTTIVLIGMIGMFWISVLAAPQAIADLNVGSTVGSTQNLLSSAELEIAKNYSATPENCAHYEVIAIYYICMGFGTNVFANVARYGLKKAFLENGYSWEWLYQDHGKWLTYAALIAADSN